MRGRSRPPAPRRRRRRRRGLLWRWIGLGAAGFAAAALLRGERRASRRRAAPAPEEGSGDAAPRRPVPDLPPDAESSWIPGPAGTLHLVERHPRGSLPIVFVHGLGGCSGQWAAQVAATGPAIRAVALDLPGHGRSDPAADGDYSIPALAAAVGAVVDALGLRRAVMVAHSLGAAVAIEYARSHGPRVAGLLLIDPSGDQTRVPEAERHRFLEQLRRDPGEELAWYFRQLLAGAGPGVAERVLEHLETVPGEVTLAALEGAARYSPLPGLEAWGGPVRGVVSDLNALPNSLHRLLPGLPVRRLPRASHWLMMDRPDEVWEEVVDFLDEVLRAGDGPEPGPARPRATGPAM